MKKETKYTKKDVCAIDFGERARAARKKMGFSQEKLAEVAGLSSDTVGRVERGESVGRLSIEILEHTLNISWDPLSCPGIYTCKNARYCLAEIAEILMNINIDAKNN